MVCSPCGWTVSYNKLSILDPEALPEGDRRWLDFTEDILQLSAHRRRRRNRRQEEQTLVLDLGWYPDSDPAGCFRLAAVLDGDEDPLLVFSSRSRAEIVERLERWLFREFMPPGWIEKEVFHKNNNKQVNL